MEPVTGYYLIFSIALFLIVVMSVIVFRVKYCNRFIYLFSKRTLIVMILPTLTLGYIAFSLDKLKADFEDQIEIIPNSRWLNLEPLWPLADKKKWLYVSSFRFEDAYEFYKNKEKLKSYVKVNKPAEIIHQDPSCGLYCFIYSNNNDRKRLMVTIGRLGKFSKIEYVIENIELINEPSFSQGSGKRS